MEMKNNMEVKMCDIKQNDRQYNEKNNKRVVQLVAINAKYIHSNLAVYCLKKYADRELGLSDEKIGILEYTINQQLEYIYSDIFKREPRVLAFSCYIWNKEYILDLISEVKKILPETDIWIGGPEVSYNAKEFMSEMPQVKGIFVGEGEISFCNVVRHYIEKNNEFTDIKGICFRNENQEIIENAPQEVMDLNDLPFPYDDLSKFENKIIYYESSRGCPFRCSYCLSSIDKKLRFRDIETVKKELKFFMENRVRQVKFVDRTFNCRKEHSVEIWKFIKENDNGITNFHFEVAADLLDNEELEIIKDMRPGLIQLEIGVQSTNKETLREIDRNMDIEKLKRIVGEIKGFKNVHQHLDLIAGLPYEDLETFKSSFNEVYEMKPDQLQLGFLKVLKGAKMHEKAADYGLIYTSKPMYEVLKTKWIGFKELRELKMVEEMVEVYYNSGQFSRTIKFIEQFYQKPYELYFELGKYYEENDLFYVKHTRLARYEILYEHFKKKFKNDSYELNNHCEANNNDYDNVEVLAQLLKFDLYMRENLKSLPSFIKHDVNEKNVIKELYAEKGLKNAGKLVHIEEFEIDVDRSRKGNILKEKKYILFDYRGAEVTYRIL